MGGILCLLGLAACTPSDVNLSRSGSFDTGYGGLDDATSGEGR